jgi:hypothetical protein
MKTKKIIHMSKRRTKRTRIKMQKKKKKMKDTIMDTVTRKNKDKIKEDT